MEDLLTGGKASELAHASIRGSFNFRQSASNNSELVSDSSSNNDNAFVSLFIDDTIKTLDLY